MRPAYFAAAIQHIHRRRSVYFRAPSISPSSNSSYDDSRHADASLLWLLQSSEATWKTVFNRTNPFSIQPQIENDHKVQEALRKRWTNNRLKRFAQPPLKCGLRTAPVTILSWHGFMNWPAIDFRKSIWTKGCPVACRVTFDRSQRDQAHVIAFHQQITEYVPTKPWQATALISLEPELANTDANWVLQRTDILASYSRYSDVQIGYLYAAANQRNKNLSVVDYWKQLGILGKLPNFSTKRTDALAVIFVSNCHHSKSAFRERYIAELQKYLPVHSYGRCMHTEGLPYGLPKIPTQKQYMFVLTFENVITEDYVTEKLYDALRSDAIPVYLGAPNVREYLPDPDDETTILDIADFNGPKELAERMLYLAANPQEYARYFEWRLRPIKASFYAKRCLLESGRDTLMCRICRQYRQKLIKE